jgi:pimeloyl-ACP methyl ester carboxylesterase
LTSTRAPGYDVAMTFARNGGIELCYETIGDPRDPALLLVSGLGSQLITWSDEWCRVLADRGRFVIRFDNRDSGLSTKLDGAEVDLPAVLAAWSSGGPMPAVPYLLSDMADDGFAVLGDLGIERAHVVGASLGGMIAQTMAVEHPVRLLTLTSIMSTTGEPAFYQWVPEVRAQLLTPPPTDREGAIAAAVESARLCGSPRYFDEADTRARRAAAFDRSFYPDGIIRQTAAIRASGSRDAALRELRVPTLVIHGAADPLIKPCGGEHTADLVRGATLLVLKDMGHDLPRPLWPLLLDAITSHTAHAIG